MLLEQSLSRAESAATDAQFESDSQMSTVAKSADGAIGQAGGATPDSLRQELVELMHQVADGDHRAFAELHNRTKLKVFGIAMGICRDRAEAEDIVADVYVSVWKRAGTYRSCQGSPITWLAAVTRNRAIDWQRTQRPSELLSTDMIEQIYDPSPSSVECIVIAQGRDALRKSFNELPLGTRVAIHDAFFEGLTYSQLATREGVPLGTMKSVIRRGLMSLRRSLSD